MIAQQSLRFIDINDARQYIGQNVKICAWVKSVRHSKIETNTKLLMYEKGAEKEHVLVVVNDKIRKAMKDFDIKTIREKFVCFNGKIITKRGELLMIVTDPFAFKNASEEEPPASR